MLTMHAFSVDRYSKAYARIDSAPRIHDIKLEPLAYKHLRLVKHEAKSSTSRNCLDPTHLRCVGHLVDGGSSRVLLPGYMVVDDPDMADARYRANEAYAQGRYDHEAYADAIEEGLMGNRGMPRYKILGGKPQTSCRGVAILSWHLATNVVALPRSWMRRMKVRDYDGNTRNLSSPYMSFREARDYDCAVLLRCPIVSDTSLQPVTVVGWDHDGIGVHPEMCDPLNLDFDGDEVHVIIVSSLRSRKEITRAIELSRLNRFEILGSAEHLDAMATTTCSMDELHEVTFDSKLDKVARCKDSSREHMVESLKSPVRTSAIDYELEWRRTVMNIVSSHLGVPKGYTFARQLKIVALSVKYDEANTWYSIPWCVQGGSDPYVAMLDKNTKEAYGLPAYRLASRLASVVVQRQLDMAKHTTASADDALLTGLFSASPEHVYVIRSNNSTRMVTSSKPPLVSDGHIVGTNDSAYAKSSMTEEESARSAVMMISIACSRARIPASKTEIFALASLVYSCIRLVGHSVITHTSPERFLSKVPADLLTAALCENSKVLNYKDTALGFTRQGMTASEPYVAIALGNLERFSSRSLAYHESLQS